MAMRSIIIAVLLALTAFAQEMNSTYVQAVYNTPAVENDSIAKILHNYERATKIGNHHKTLGTGLIIAGSVGLCAGVAVTAYAIKNHIDYEHDAEKYSYEEGDSGSAFLFFLGGSSIFVGGASIITGIIFRSNGQKRLDRANGYEEQLRQYNQRSTSLSIVPLINPIGQAFGGNLLLNF